MRLPCLVCRAVDRTVNLEMRAYYCMKEKNAQESQMGYILMARVCCGTAKETLPGFAGLDGSTLVELVELLVRQLTPNAQVVVSKPDIDIDKLIENLQSEVREMPDNVVKRLQQAKLPVTVKPVAAKAYVMSSC